MIDMDRWAEYYTNPDNLNNISKSCKYREVVIIRQVENRKITVRPIKVFKPEHLKFWIERLNLRKTLFDIYISNASVKLPPLPADMTKLKETREYLNEHWEDLLTGYDIFVDIDVEKKEQREVALRWAKRIVVDLVNNKYQKTQLWDTGGGFHIFDLGRFTPDFVKNLIMDICCEKQIPMSNPVKEVDGVKYLAEGGRWIKIKQDEEAPVVEKPNVDTRIWDIRRIRRVPYSLHSKSGRPMVRIL
jgi:hypothetical protein